MNARYAAAVDDLSGGRLVSWAWGLAGRLANISKFGIPFHDFSRGATSMLEEALELSRLLLRSDTPSDYQGTPIISWRDAILLPRPARAGGPPILIGGNGPKKTLPLAAKYADEWNAVYVAM